jgi:hypothetical protein
VKRAKLKDKDVMKMVNPYKIMFGMVFLTLFKKAVNKKVK